MERRATVARAEIAAIRRDRTRGAIHADETTWMEMTVQGPELALSLPNGAVWPRGVNPTLHFFDGLGSVVALSDAAGDTVQTYAYTVFGEPAASDANHPNPFLFTARRFDPETGLSHYRARAYNPYLGRLLQTDPA